jgi:hypothetical protein
MTGQRRSVGSGSRHSIERVAILMSLALLLGLAGFMVAGALPRPGVPVVSYALDRRGGALGDALTLLFGFHAGLGGAAIVCRRLTLIHLALGGIAGVVVIGLTAALTSYEYPGHYVQAAMLPILLLPWLWRRVAWPMRSAGQLAVAVALCVTMGLQVLFHLTLIMPATEAFRSAFVSAEALVIATQSPEELALLAARGVAGIEPLTQDLSNGGLRAFPQEPLSQLRGGMGQLLAEAPHLLHTWTIEGLSPPDRLLAVYDGRGETPASYVVLMEAHAGVRHHAQAVYVTLTGASSIVWMGGALLVAWGHGRRKRVPQDR